MAAYLIDYENVKSEGIRGILQLCEQDSVIIFYSHNADTLTFETMDMIFGSKATVRKYKIVRGGKNALDFQLSTYLGYLIHEGKDSCFYIISKDNGFQHVVEFWKRTFNYDGYVYCFPTIADAYAKQRRFETTSAKERAKAIEEDMLALQVTTDEEPETSVVFEESVVESASEESASEPEIEEETIFDTEEEINVPTEEYSTEEPEEEKPQSIITITSHEDNFIIEAIHDDAAVSSAESSEPEKKPAQIPVFSESLAEKIAAAVPDSWLKVTVVENNVTVHQVPEESETVKPAAVSIQESVSDTTCTSEEPSHSDPDKVTAKSVPAQPEIIVSPVPQTAESEPETAVEEITDAPASVPAEKSEKLAAKKKPRQTSKKKTPSQKSDSIEEKSEPTADVIEPAAESKPAAETSEESSSEDAAKSSRRKSSHHGGRRKKTAAPASEPESVPVSSVSEEKEPEHKQHRAHTGTQRGRRPKAQKSEASAFTE